MIFLKTRIVTDSTTYLSQDILESYGIDSVSLSVSFEHGNYRENQISNEFFFSEIDKIDEIPKSSQPAIQEIYDAFEKNVLQGHPVVGVFISAGLSGTYETACLVKKQLLDKYPDADIEVINSGSTCMQMGFQVLAGAQKAQAGASFEQVVAAIMDVRDKSKIIFAPKTLEYLKKGGRIGAAGALIGSLLQIFPILTVVDGKVVVERKVRTKKKIIETLIDICCKDIEKYGLGKIGIQHINNTEQAVMLAEIMEEKTGAKIDIFDIGPVVGAHVGPGAIGMSYYTKESHS